VRRVRNRHVLEHIDRPTRPKPRGGTFAAPCSPTDGICVATGAAEPDALLSLLDWAGDLFAPAAPARRKTRCSKGLLGCG
jgi:hypothetical protein